jgi:hypothetical protein
VVIHRSSAAHVAPLIRDLLEGSPVQREAAAARLAIAGERAESALLKALDRSEARDRAALLHVLERLDRPRALGAAIAHLQDADTSVAIAAVAAARPHLQAQDSTRAASAFEALVSVCVAAQRPEAVRLAAIEAIGDLGDAGLAPLRDRLADDGSERVRAALAPAAGAADAVARAAAARLEALAASPGDDPHAIRELVADAGARVPLSTLHTLILRLSERERASARPADQAGWNAALATAHRVLAERGSRLALFDLREAIPRTPPERLGDLVTAARLVGDGSCLAPLAEALPRASGALHDRIAEAFRTIVRREGLTRRHAALRRVLERHPEAGVLLE